MPRKSAQANELSSEEADNTQQIPLDQQNDELGNLSRMLASVLEYLADDENEEIDIEYIFDKTEGLRDWWRKYQENNRKRIEEEIKESLGALSFEDLQHIREQIRNNRADIH